MRKKRRSGVMHCDYLKVGCLISMISSLKDFEKETKYIFFLNDAFTSHGSKECTCLVLGGLNIFLGNTAGH